MAGVDGATVLGRAGDLVWLWSWGLRGFTTGDTEELGLLRGIVPIWTGPSFQVKVVRHMGGVYFCGKRLEIKFEVRGPWFPPERRAGPRP